MAGAVVGCDVVQSQGMSDAAPQLRDVLDAQRVIAPYLDRTPVRRYRSLDRIVGAELLVKHENHQPTGAFKVRGGINLVVRLDSQLHAAGVYTASTGNHGQSVAYAASLFDIAATIFVPRGANPVKVSSMRSLDATVLERGRDFDEARERCEEVAADHGARYIHSGNEPLLIAGVATATLELFERERSSDVIVVPVGGSSGAASAGAAPLAAALKLREQLAGQRVALVCSGATSAPLSFASCWSGVAPGSQPRTRRPRRADHRGHGRCVSSSTHQAHASGRRDQMHESREPERVADGCRWKHASGPRPRRAQKQKYRAAELGDPLRRMARVRERASRRVKASVNAAGRAEPGP